MHADRMFTFFALEKSSSNPHWHGLIRFYSQDPAERLRQEQEFDRVAARCWVKLVPSGTTDVQAIFDNLGAAEYISKTMEYDVSYEHYVVPDELRNG